MNSTKAITRATTAATPNITTPIVQPIPTLNTPASTNMPKAPSPRSRLKKINDFFIVVSSREMEPSILLDGTPSLSRQRRGGLIFPTCRMHSYDRKRNIELGHPHLPTLCYTDMSNG